MKKTGFYIIKNTFFEIMNDLYLKGNKEEKRPHYYCFEESETGIFWMIPLSSRIGKYQQIIDKREKQGKRCDILHIAKLADGRESVFLLQDMFPITEKYIEREYTVGGQHFILTSESTVKQIESKAKRVMKLLKNGIQFMPTQPDVNRIYMKLKEEGTEPAGKKDN